MRTFDLKADAEVWARVIESEMDRGVFVSRAEAERTTLREALDRYEQEVSRVKRGWKAECYKLNSLRASNLADYYLANIRGADIARWRDAFLATHKPGTCVWMLALLGHVFEVCRCDWGMEGLTNPLRSIRKPSLVGSERSRGLLPGEEEELLTRARHCGDAIGPIIVLALETAMRRGEIASLRWNQINLKRRIVYLEGERGRRTAQPGTCR